MENTQYWKETTFVAFDLETSGAYPIGDHICEIGAVKWQNGKIIDEFQTLIKPPVIMSDFIIGIHNITNEMVANAPSISDKIKDFHSFIQGAYLVAHHSPFDLGFLALEFERHKLPFPREKVFCSSVMSIKAIKGVENHKLQTLIQFLKIDGGQAHRGMDDAKACLEVLLHCFRSFDPEKNIQQLLDYQKINIQWSNFSIDTLIKKHSYGADIVTAIEERKDLELIYSGGSKPGKPRVLCPIGLVRNPNGDFLVAFEKNDGVKSEKTKRYYLNRVKDAALI
ncbi:MAG: exonuclease [Bdellovibrionaceae bacterium]|jgi:DNA polymerase III subunit epsilon|nr:exonuclease [Pseudobdellovibrionaceae bacterium]